MDGCGGQDPQNRREVEEQPPPALDGHLRHFPCLLTARDDMKTFSGLHSELKYAPGDTHDGRFRLRVHRPDRRGCATAMDAVLRTGSTALCQVVEQVCSAFRLELHRCWVNLYRGGTDDRSEFHRDNFDGRSGSDRVNLGVFASFGAPRDLCWQWHRPERGGGKASGKGADQLWRVQQCNGDVFAFDRYANNAGLHCIEPDLTRGDRISVSIWGHTQFRTLNEVYVPAPPDLILADKSVRDAYNEEEEEQEEDKQPTRRWNLRAGAKGGETSGRQRRWVQKTV